MTAVEGKRQTEVSLADNGAQTIPADLQLQYFLRDVRRYCELQAELQILAKTEPLNSFLETLQGQGDWEDVAKTMRWLGLPGET